MADLNPGPEVLERLKTLERWGVRDVTFGYHDEDDDKVGDEVRWGVELTDALGDRWASGWRPGLAGLLVAFDDAVGPASRAWWARTLTYLETVLPEARSYGERGAYVRLTTGGQLPPDLPVGPVGHALVDGRRDRVGYLFTVDAAEVLRERARQEVHRG